MEEHQREIIKLLSEQNQLLRSLLSSEQKPELGFSDRPPGIPQWVFVGRNGEDCWYTLDEGNQQVRIRARAMTGYLSAISVDKAMRRGKEVDKLNVTVRADSNTYIVSSGVETCFAKSLLASLAILSPEQLRSPITLSVAPGEDESVVWCRVFVHTLASRSACAERSRSAPDYVKAPSWDEHTDWQALFNSVAAHFVFDSDQDKLSTSTSQDVSFPQHNSFIKRIRGISGHSTEWIIARCRHYGAKQPGDLPPARLRKLVSDMAADYGATTGVFSSKEGAASAYEGRIAFYEGAGKRWGEGVLSWFEEVKSRVTVTL